MASHYLPDLTVAEYNSRPEQIGSRLPYYHHILVTVAPITTKQMTPKQVQGLIRAETNRYVSHGSVSTQSNSRRNNTRKNNRNGNTRKNKKIAVSKNVAKTPNTHKNNRQNSNNEFNDPFYKANATGYIPALNYRSNNNYF